MRGTKITPLEIRASCLAVTAVALLAPGAIEAVRALSAPPPAPSAVSPAASAAQEEDAQATVRTVAADAAVLLERPLFALNQRPPAPEVEASPEPPPPEPDAGAETVRRLPSLYILCGAKSLSLKGMFDGLLKALVNDEMFH